MDPVISSWESPYVTNHLNPIYFKDEIGADPWNRAYRYAEKHNLKNFEIRSNGEGKGVFLQWGLEGEIGVVGKDFGENIFEKIGNRLIVNIESKGSVGLQGGLIFRTKDFKAGVEAGTATFDLVKMHYDFDKSIFSLRKGEQKMHNYFSVEGKIKYNKNRAGCGALLDYSKAYYNSYDDGIQFIPNSAIFESSTYGYLDFSNNSKAKIGTKTSTELSKKQSDITHTIEFNYSVKAIFGIEASIELGYKEEKK